MRRSSKFMLTGVITLSAIIALPSCSASDVAFVKEALGEVELSTSTPTTTASPTPAPEVVGDLGLLVVEPAGDASDYYRTGQFGEAWIDVDGNGCDTRNDILNRDLVGITYKYIDDTCTVLTGTLIDPYTGAAIQFERGEHSADVQIDHVIPLQYAWIHGARNLTQEQRIELANDPQNLYAVDGPTNSSKGAKGPENWMPPSEAFHCQYAQSFVNVAVKYGISVTAADFDALGWALTSCPV